MLITGEDSSEDENEDMNDKIKKYEEEDPSTAPQPNLVNGGNGNTQDEQDDENTATETESDESNYEGQLIPNCNAMQQDILRAEDIFGPNMWSVKGNHKRSYKTCEFDMNSSTRRNSKYVLGCDTGN